MNILRFRNYTFFLIILALALMAIGCSGDEKLDYGETDLVLVPKEDSRKKWEAYQKELAQSPVYRSEIRDTLIAKASSYRPTVWSSVEEFYNEESQFRCNVPVELVNRFAIENWELVRCERAGPVFFRKVADIGSCGSLPSILDEYEVLQISLNAKSFDRGNPERARHLKRIFNYYRMGNLEVPNDVKARLTGGALGNLRFSRLTVPGGYKYSVIDPEAERMVWLTRRSGDPDCHVSSGGVATGDGMIVTVNTPNQNYHHVIGMLEEAQRTLEKTQ